jgi:hypothetical protein
MSDFGTSLRAERRATWCCRETVCFFLPDSLTLKAGWAADRWERLSADTFRPDNPSFFAPDEDYEDWTFYEAGWPARCAWGWKVFCINEIDTSTCSRGVIHLPRLRGGQDGASAVASWPTPLLPTWPGIVMNSTFYGGILWLLWSTPRMIRRASLRRRGRCARCGYDLCSAHADAAGTTAPHLGTVCPECGGAS